jgi:hypothetical protein
MREDDYKPIIIDHLSLIGNPNGGSYYVKQEWLDRLTALSKIYDVTIITGSQKPKFTLGKLKLLNIV